MYVLKVCYFDADFMYTHTQIMICPGRDMLAVREFVKNNYKPDLLNSKDKYFVATPEDQDPIMGVL